MPPVIGRLVYAGAAALLAASLIGLNRSAQRVAHVETELYGGVPAVVYDPAPGGVGELPVAILVHDFATSKAGMSLLARRLARAGYASVAIDLRGHGRSPDSLATGVSVPSGFGAELDAALLYASTQERFDPQRIAFVGHGLGADAVLEHASRAPGVAAVVAMSVSRAPRGPYTPPNVLLMFAAGDPWEFERAARELGARFAALDRVILERTYGEVVRGSGVRLSEVAGSDHLALPYSGDVAQRIASWLSQTLGPAAGSGGSEWSAVWSALGGVAYLVLFAGLVGVLAPFTPRVERVAPRRPLFRLGAVAGSLLLAGLLLFGVDREASAGPASWLPLVAARELLALLAVAGAGLLVALARASEVRAVGLWAPQTWAVSAVLLSFSYLALGTLGEPYLELWLSPRRSLAALLAAALALPFFGAFEWLLRGPGRSGVWLPIAGRVVVLAAVASASLLGRLAPLFLMASGALALLLLLLEAKCWWFCRSAPSPWLAALYQAGLTGWLAAALFPLD